jgi:hypothetical protein
MAQQYKAYLLFSTLICAILNFFAIFSVFKRSIARYIWVEFDESSALRTENCELLDAANICIVTAEPKPFQSAAQTVPMLDLKRQYLPLHNELLEALGHVLEAQQFILGEPVAAFERAAAERLKVAHAVGCSSGTDALWLALAAAGINPGETVITTPFSFFASVSAILRA